ncbi:MAG TPA: DUF11 domain-containing protein [Thermoanaerobaculia bacterium]|jgi:uncharacterized repeat protein (TIGR01451 family)
MSLRAPSTRRTTILAGCRPRPAIRAALPLLAILATLAAPVAAQTNPAGSAFGESIDLHLLPLLGGGIPILSPPQAFVAGSAPPAYDLSASRLSLSVATPLTGTLLTTSLLNAHAASTGAALDGATANASVDRASVRLLGALPLLTLSAETIRSSATLGGPCAGGPASTGTADLVNLRLGGPLGAGITFNGAAAPNTVLLDVAGIRVVLNEQLVSTSGTTTSLTVNSVHVSAHGAVTALGVLSGDIILAQSQAQLGCGEVADLALVKEASVSSINQGNSFDYLLTITNNGPGTAHGVTVSDALPAQVTLLAAAPSQGSCSGGPAVSCDLGDLAPGDTVTVDLTVRGDTVGTFTNSATVTSATPDPDASNNQSSVDVTVDSPPMS